MIRLSTYQEIYFYYEEYIIVVSFFFLNLLCLLLDFLLDSIIYVCIVGELCTLELTIGRYISDMLKYCVNNHRHFVFLLTRAND